VLHGKRDRRTSNATRPPAKNGILHVNTHAAGSACVGAADNAVSLHDPNVVSLLNTVTCGDCFQVLRRLPEGVVDLVVTDPPYAISDAATRYSLRDGRKQQRRTRTVDFGPWDHFVSRDSYRSWLFESADALFRVLRTGVGLYRQGAARVLERRFAWSCAGVAGKALRREVVRRWNSVWYQVLVLGRRRSGRDA